MESKGRESGGDKSEVVTLEAFITSNWQILTIFGVFAGFTNYMKGIESDWLVTLCFALTFIVELEILQLLLRIKNGSILLRAFTLLSGVFMLFFGGFIYSNYVSGILSGFGVVVYPVFSEYRVFILRTVFFISIMLVVLGLYKYLRSMSDAALRLIGGSEKLPSVRAVSMILVIAVALMLAVWLSIAPAGTGPAESAITTTTTATTLQCVPPQAGISGECCIDSDTDGICDKNEGAITTTTAPVETTTTTVSSIACFSNIDCGNETETRICYQNDVYLQQQTPLCRQSGTPEARCVNKVGLVGDTLTQKATPIERCSRGCKDGECVTRQYNSTD